MAMNDKTFSEALTFTRASTKWVWNSTGTLVEVPVDEPAYDHDPVTGEALGVLIEPSRTNENIWSEEIGQWPMGRCLLESVTGVKNPLGKASVYRVSADVSDDIHFFRDGFTQPSNVAYRRTYIVKADGIQRLAFGRNTADASRPPQINLSTLEVTESGDSLTIESAKHIGDGWVSVTIGSSTELYSARLPRIYLLDDTVGYGVTHGNLAFEGDGQKGIYVLCAQAEEGDTPTSYIPTAGAAVTRAADNISRDLGAEFNPSAGTIFVEYETPIDVSSEYSTFGRRRGLLFRLSGNGGSIASNQFVAGRFRGDLNFTFRDLDGTGYDFGASGPSLPYGQKNKIAICYNSGVGIISAVNGSSVTHARPELPSVNWSDMSLTTAYDGSTFFGHKSNVRYYPYAMTAAELEALTAL